MSGDKMIFKVKRMNENATLPTKAKQSDAGYDLYAAEDAVVEFGKITVISTGIAIQLPDVKDKDISCYGRVAPRSGLATKHGIHTMAGVVDNGYRGEVKVALTKLSSDDPYQIKKGDRIAQLIIETHLTPQIIDAIELDDSDRGSDGFGSSGK
jgi:dUTP pyrophosphatase